MQVCTSCAIVVPSDVRKCPDDGAAVRAVESLPEGARLGSYRVVRQLGEGGMGFVYEASHDVLGRRVALKLLRSELTCDAGIVTRFLQEARAVNLIDHDHIVDIHDYGDGTTGAVYFVMEYLEGQTLADLLTARRRFGLPLFIHLFEQIMSALAAAHAKQIVHRDLKPANVFVIHREDSPFFVKLLDFGVAKLMGESAISGLTNAGALIGTPQFMSPEQVEGKPADARSDVFALGIMMYRAAVGHLPWSGKNFGELATKILCERPAPPRVAAPDADIPPALEALILKALHKKPEDRYQRVVDLLADLDVIRAEARIERDDLGVDALDLPAHMRADLAERAPSTVGATAGLGRSLPIYQGADPDARPAYAPGRRGPARLIAIVIAAVAVAAVAAVAVVRTPAAAPATAAETTPIAPRERQAEVESTLATDVAAGRIGEAAARAERELAAQIDSRDAAERDAAMSGLRYAANPNALPLLYRALGGDPQLRVRSAALLADLKLPEAAPRIRSALSRSGDRVRVDLAASLVALGDRDALAILEQSLDSEPGQSLAAAAALAEAGVGERARGVMAAVFEQTPTGRERWRIAARGLARLGDRRAVDALRRELASPEAARSEAAAEVLADLGERDGVAYLGRVVADEEFDARPAAALALARTGDAAALEFVGRGLFSRDPAARASAIGVAALLADRGGRDHAAAIAELAVDDPDASVRAAARVGLVAMKRTGDR